MGSVELQRVTEGRRIETSGPHGGGGNTDFTERVVRVLQLLIVEIEEQLVLEDRPTDRAAKVIVALLCLRGAVPSRMVEVASRIQGVVLEILVERAVKLIGSILADEVENVAAAAILRCGG